MNGEWGRASDPASVVPGMAEAVGRRFPGTKKFPCSRIALSAARMKVDLPTLADPRTYTSRPLRWLNMAPTAYVPGPWSIHTHTHTFLAAQLKDLTRGKHVLFIGG